MAPEPERSREQQQRTVQTLLPLAERAHGLARELYEELWRTQTRDKERGLTPTRYALGICLGDAEIATNRLAGLRNELEELLETLERQARSA